MYGLCLELNAFDKMMSINLYSMLIVGNNNYKIQVSQDTTQSRIYECLKYNLA